MKRDIGSWLVDLFVGLVFWSAVLTVMIALYMRSNPRHEVTPRVNVRHGR